LRQPPRDAKSGLGSGNPENDMSNKRSNTKQSNAQCTVNKILIKVDQRPLKAERRVRAPYALPALRCVHRRAAQDEKPLLNEKSGGIGVGEDIGWIPDIQQVKFVAEAARTAAATALEWAQIPWNYQFHGNRLTVSIKSE
jgi:hypothetical protein